MTRATLAALLVFAVFQIPARAGQDRSDLISRDLVERLFGGMGVSTAIVEGLPAGFPAALIPDGGNPRISMSSSFMSTVVVEAPSFTAADSPRYERKIAASGWARLEGPSGRRGLVTRPAPPTAIWCQDGKQAYYALEPRSEGGSWIRVHLSTMGGAASCDEMAGGGGRLRLIFEDERMPALGPPEGSRGISMGTSSSRDYQEQQIRLATDLNAAKISDHYKALITAHGWKAAAEAAVEGLSIVRYAAPVGENNREVPLIVTAMTLPDGDVSVTMRVLLPETSRR